jgi:hypothetical protein
MSHHKEYGVYISARNRCQNPRNKDYKKYGGRGIEFRFNSFPEWVEAFGPKPAGMDTNGRSLYSVDRENNNGHYEPGNIRWATAQEQGANRRKSGVLERFTTEELVQELNRRGLFAAKGRGA